ncbi:unnamed protein product [Euphydryas editha]|uniref:Uncharacterized protein n=1 Tax=Euphydryas editha TaxID=104508 RepID=A0AAU9UAZ6_EUPED|nr:unnamed protein product [Euphydryas editha]
MRFCAPGTALLMQSRPVERPHGAVEHTFPRMLSGATAIARGAAAEDGREAVEEFMTGVGSDISHGSLANASASSKGGKQLHKSSQTASDEASEASVISARPNRKTKREEPCTEETFEVQMRAAEESHRALALDVGDPCLADDLRRQGYYIFNDMKLSLIEIPESFPFQEGRLFMNLTHERLLVGTGHLDFVMKTID